MYTRDVLSLFLKNIVGRVTYSTAQSTFPHAAGQEIGISVLGQASCSLSGITKTNKGLGIVMTGNELLRWTN